MDGFDFYKLFQSLRLHFYTDYDVFKFRGSTRIKNREKFDVLPEAERFNSWANTFQNKKEAGQVCIANNVYNTEFWVYDDDKEEAKNTYLRWLGIRESLTKRFSDDVKTISKLLTEKESTYATIIKRTPNGNLPPLLQLYLANRITAESVVILDSIHTPFLNKWQADYNNDPLIKTKVFILRKYKPFVQFEATKLSPIFKEVKQQNEANI